MLRVLAALAAALGVSLAAQAQTYPCCRNLALKSGAPVIACDRELHFPVVGRLIGRKH